jgi:hypothetical protein
MIKHMFRDELVEFCNKLVSAQVDETRETHWF